MGSHFSGVRLKIEWAGEKVREVQGRIDTFFGNPDAYTPFCEVEPETGRRLLKARLVDKLPSDLLRITAEHVYHVRSALDLLACALATINGETTKNVYFPFAGDANEFVGPGTQGKIKKLAPDDVAIISSLKPYRGGNDVLWALSRLSNIDRHVDLIPVTDGARRATIHNAEFFAGTIGYGIGIATRSGESLYDGVTLVDVGPDGNFGFSEKTQVNLAADVVFGNVDVFAGKSLVPTLHQLTQLVDGIVRQFEARYP